MQDLYIKFLPINSWRRRNISSDQRLSKLLPYMNCCHTWTVAIHELLPYVNCCHTWTVAIRELLPYVNCSGHSWSNFSKSLKFIQVNFIGDTKRTKFLQYLTCNYHPVAWLSFTVFYRVHQVLAYPPCSQL